MERGTKVLIATVVIAGAAGLAASALSVASIFTTKASATRAVMQADESTETEIPDTLSSLQVEASWAEAQEEDTSTEEPAEEDAESQTEAPALPTAQELGLTAAEFVRVDKTGVLVVKLSDARSGGIPVEYKVRLLGVTFPDTSAASADLEELLDGTKTVYLQQDGDDTDRSGNLLRYVWLSVPEGLSDTGEISGKMVNAVLVCDHTADPDPEGTGLLYGKTFQELSAQRQGTGVQTEQ
jgi:hypothetical protein